jgi:hypothetical protein
MKPGSTGDLIRNSRAARRVGIGRKCSCGEDRPLALITGSNPIICAECKRRAEGRTTFDEHHPASRANSDFTMPIPANDHTAVLSAAQYDWPRQTLKNPEGSPLLAAAGSIRGYADLMQYVTDKLLIPAAEKLEAEDATRAPAVKPRKSVVTKPVNKRRKS